MSVPAVLRSVASCACLFLLLSVSSGSQSMINPLPKELNRPDLVTNKSKLTENEQRIMDAFLNLNLSDKSTSVRVLSDFISRYPDVGAGYAMRASEYGCDTAQPDVQKAYEDAKHALDLPPDSLKFGNVTTVITAKAALRLNRPKETIAILTDAIIHHLHDQDLLQSKTGKIEQSEPSLCEWGLSDFDVMSIASPSDWRVSLIRGVYYASLINLTDEALFAKAIEQYRKAAMLNPKSPIPFYLLGEIQEKSAYFSERSMKSPDGKRAEHLKAIPAFSEAIRVDPNLTLAYLGRAEAYLEALEPTQSVRDFTVVIDREPDNASALADRGNAYVDHHDYYRAISDFGDAIRLEAKTGDPYINDLYGNRGDAYVAVHDLPRAIDDYTDAISLTLRTQVRLGTLAQMRSLYPEGNDMTDKAFLHMLHQGLDPDEDEETFDKQIFGNKTPWVVSFLLSDLYEKRGDLYFQVKDYAAALNDFKRIYDGVPNMAGSLERWRSAGFADYLLDVKTSSVTGRAANLWVKKIEKAGTSSVLNFSIDCDKRRIKQDAAYTYDRDGNLKNSESSGTWDGLIPDSFGEHLWEASCTKPSS